MIRTTVLLASILVLIIIVLCECESTTEELSETGVPCNSNNKTDGSCRKCFCDTDGQILDCTAELCEVQRENSRTDTVDYFVDYGAKFDCSSDIIPVHPCYRCFCNSEGKVFHCELKLNHKCFFRKGRREENEELPCPNEVIRTVRPCVHCFCNSSGVVLRCDSRSCGAIRSDPEPETVCPEEEIAPIRPCHKCYCNLKGEPLRCEPVEGCKEESLASAVIFGVMKYHYPYFITRPIPLGIPPPKVLTVTESALGLSASNDLLASTLQTPQHSKVPEANQTTIEPLKEGNKYEQSDNAYRANDILMSDVISTISPNEKNLQKSGMEVVAASESSDEDGMSKSLEDAAKAGNISKSDNLPTLKQCDEHPKDEEAKLLGSYSSIVEGGNSSSLSNEGNANDSFNVDVPPPEERIENHEMVSTTLTPPDVLKESQIRSEMSRSNDILESSLLITFPPPEDNLKVREASVNSREHPSNAADPNQVTRRDLVSECPAVYLPNPACQLCLCDVLGKILTCKWICEGSGRYISSQSKLSTCPSEKIPNPECRTCQCDEQGNVLTCNWTCRRTEYERADTQVLSRCPPDKIPNSKCQICECEASGRIRACTWICHGLEHIHRSRSRRHSCPPNKIPNPECQDCECDEHGKIWMCSWICYGTDPVRRSISEDQWPAENIPNPQCKKCEYDENGNVLQCINICLE